MRFTSSLLRFRFAGALLVTGHPAFGAPPPAVTLSLRAAIEAVKAFSPEIKQARAQAEAAHARAAGAWGPQDPTFQVLRNDVLHEWRPNVAASTVYQINQPFAFPGKAFVNHAALTNLALAQAAQASAAELQIAATARAAYLQLALAQESARVNHEQRQALERITEITKRRYAAGAITQVDLLNAEQSLYANENDANDLIAAERTQRAQLNVMMGRPSVDPVVTEAFEVEDWPVPTEAEAEARTLENRRELRALRFQARAADHAFTLAKLSLLPDVTLTLGMTDYQPYGATPWSATYPDLTRQRTYMYGVQINVPLWGLFSQRHAIEGASRDRAAAAASLTTGLTQARAGVVALLENLNALKKRLTLSKRHLLPLSDQALSLALAGYSTGKIDYQALVGTADQRRNARRDYLNALVAFRNAYSNLGQYFGEEQ